MMIVKFDNIEVNINNKDTEKRIKGYILFKKNERYNTPARAFTEEERDLIIQAQQDGVSAKQIAAEYGVKTQVIIGVIAAYKKYHKSLERVEL